MTEFCKTVGNTRLLNKNSSKQVYTISDQKDEEEDEADEEESKTVINKVRVKGEGSMVYVSLVCSF